jgi:uncharacterized membrane protein
MTSTAEDDEPDVSGRAVESAAREGYDVGRLLAFSDGVFAIAITLLVLSIPVPNVPDSTDKAAQAAQLAAALIAERGQLLGFALSFVLVGGQWILHHQMLRRLTSCDARVLWLNLLILLGICLVPFATSVLVRYGDTSTGAISYAVWQTLIALAFMTMRLYLASRGDARHVSVLLSVVPLAGFVISVPVALWHVDWAYYVWVGGFVAARVVDARLRPGHRLLWTRSPS